MDGAVSDHVFVGGTGRSGTTIVGRLLGEHSRCHCLPFEARFHTELHGLFRGRTTTETYVDGIRRRWAGSRSSAVPAGYVDAALDLFALTFASEGWHAASRLVRALLDAEATMARKPALVEMTPANIFVASELRSMLPDAILVHTIRDGRDVASSVATT